MNYLVPFKGVSYICYAWDQWSPNHRTLWSKILHPGVWYSNGEALSLYAAANIHCPGLHTYLCHAAASSSCHHRMLCTTNFLWKWLPSTCLCKEQECWLWSRTIRLTTTITVPRQKIMDHSGLWFGDSWSHAQQGRQDIHCIICLMQDIHCVVYFVYASQAKHDVCRALKICQFKIDQKSWSGFCWLPEMDKTLTTHTRLHFSTRDVLTKCNQWYSWFCSLCPITNSAQPLQP